MVAGSQLELQPLRQPSMQIEDWEPSDQSPPCHITPRGVHQEACPVLKLHVQLRQQATFEDDSGEDTRAGEPHPLTWEDDERTGEPSEWSRPEARPDDEDLRCPPALEPSSPRVPIRRRCTLGQRWNRGQPLGRPLCLNPSHRVSMRWIGWCTCSR